MGVEQKTFIFQYVLYLCVFRQELSVSEWVCICTCLYVKLMSIYLAYERISERISVFLHASVHEYVYCTSIGLNRDNDSVLFVVWFCGVSRTCLIRFELISVR